MSQGKSSSKGTQSRAGKSATAPPSRRGRRRRRRRARRQAESVLRSIGESVVEGAEAVANVGAKLIEGVKERLSPTSASTRSPSRGKAKSSTSRPARRRNPPDPLRAARRRPRRNPRRPRLRYPPPRPRGRRRSRAGRPRAPRRSRPAPGSLAEAKLANRNLAGPRKCRYHRPRRPPPRRDTETIAGQRTGETRSERGTTKTTRKNADPCGAGDGLTSRSPFVYLVFFVVPSPFSPR